MITSLLLTSCKFKSDCLWAFETHMSKCMTFCSVLNCHLANKRTWQNHLNVRLIPPCKLYLYSKDLYIWVGEGKGNKNTLRFLPNLYALDWLLILPNFLGTRVKMRHRGKGLWLSLWSMWAWWIWVGKDIVFNLPLWTGRRSECLWLEWYLTEEGEYSSFWWGGDQAQRSNLPMLVSI